MTKEEAIKILQNIVKHNEDEDAAIFMAIRALRDASSLPSDLDDAAHKFAVFYDQGTCDGIAQDCFKSGAEWMAGQGLTVDGTFHHSCGYPSVIELKTYLREYEGADVIVQIRKKQ